MKGFCLLESAFRDLEDGVEFYEQQESGVGILFYDTLLGEIRLLGNFVGIHRKRRGFHCYVSKTFPFGVYYRVINEIAEVTAVLDMRRSPRAIARVLKNR
ncbi:MAG: hypothetical protein JWO89_2782 [Verrucomicrobiaceae bacterium]|nr:hypothetical protein [Verrucomicrobiaceae bacterium]MDB6117683.1 hypothetical protein [Verrucomicrobiaceae bacterium]